MLLGTIAIFMIVTHFWKCRNEYTLPNESGRTKSLLWSYANEVADRTIECNNVHEESPKTCINREYEEPGHTEPDLTDVRPVYSQINRFEDRYNDKRSAEANAKFESRYHWKRAYRICSLFGRLVKYKEIEIR